MSINQNPEQIARDRIDKMLAHSGWLVQSKNEIDLNAKKGVAVREYQTVLCKLNPAARTAHLVFADTKANAEKQKSCFLPMLNRKSNKIRETVI